MIERFFRSYQYVQNHPVIMTDPWGLKAICASGKCLKNGGDCPGGHWKGTSAWAAIGAGFFGYISEEVCLTCMTNKKKICFSSRCGFGGKYIDISKWRMSIGGGVGVGAGFWDCWGAHCLEDLLGNSAGVGGSFGNIGVLGVGLTIGEGSICLSRY